MFQQSSCTLVLALAFILSVVGCKQETRQRHSNPKVTQRKVVAAPVSRRSVVRKKPAKARKKPVYDLRKTQWTLGKKFQVSYSTKPAKIPLNDYFDLTFVVKDAQGKPVSGVKFKADADMPEHRHGMKVYPKQTSKGKGIFHIQGFLFHMPGHWVIEADVIVGGKKHRASFHVVL